MKEYYKKIDKSFFDGKVTIPNDYIDCFIDPSEMEERTSRTINIKFKSKTYPGKYCFVHQSNGRKVFQISYGNDLTTKLKQEFIQTYFAINSQKLLLNDGEKFKTNLMGGNQEVVIFRSMNFSTIEFVTFIKIETPYDNVFKSLVEQNVFGWLNKSNEAKIITKYSTWKDIDELNKHVDVAYVVYYLVDDTNKQIYIGSAKRLGDRVKPNRTEIPNWNRFMYEIIHPDYHDCLKEIEYHSIMTFAKFLKNNGNKKNAIDISEYVLVNKDYQYYKN